MDALTTLPPAERWQPAVERAGLIAGQLAQLHADLVELMVDVVASGAWAGDGIKTPEHWLCVVAAMSPARAKDIVTIARRRSDFPELVDEFEAGQISVDQLAVVAKHVPAEYAESVTTFVPAATVPQLRRVLGKYQFELPDADAPGPAQVAPEDGTAEIRHDDPVVSMGTTDGRFHLKFEANPLDGALVEQALREAKDTLFNEGDVTATLADAMLLIASRSLKSVESDSRREQYKVMVHLSADGRGWINKGGGALPQHLVDKLTCEGDLRPVWLDGASPVSVGRSMRIVPARTRTLVEDRDGGCRFPGCTATGFLENHHLQHWRKGGTTDMDTVISLCPRHHSQHHQGFFSITESPATPDGLVFRGHGGWEIAPQIPEHIPRPSHDPPVEQPTRGWPMDTSCIFFSPHRPAA